MERERQEILRQFDRTASVTLSPFHDDPMQMLAELDRHSQSIISNLDSADTLVDDLDSLRVEFASLRSSHPDNGGTASPAVSSMSAQDKERRIDVPYGAEVEPGQSRTSAGLGSPTVECPATDKISYVYTDLLS
jgi:hypothetical protein